MPEQSSLPWHRRGPRRDALPPGRAPSGARLVGRDAVSLRVYLRRAAWDAIDQLAASHEPPREAGGLLLGRVCRDEEGPLILVEDALPAPQGPPGLGPFRFAQQDWDFFHGQWRRQGARQLVVGWFHTHPGYGARPLAYDHILAERYFPEWWQLSYIIDPVNMRQGMFRWQDGELTPLAGFWVYDEDWVADAAASAAGPIPGRRRAAALGWPLALLLLAAFAWLPGLPGSLPALRQALARQESKAAQLREELHALQARHAALEQALAGARQGSLAGGASVGEPVQAAPPGAPSAAPPAAAVPAAVVVPGPSAGTSGPAGTGSSGPTDGGTPYELRYVVRAGDTLWHISGQLLGDPLAYPRLADLNRIADPDLILPGWELRIPLGVGPPADSPDD
ncbi:MAG TPA: LysM peptidoglycan-binding domain-containing protein [Limnochordales bacterium]